MALKIPDQVTKMEESLSFFQMSFDGGLFNLYNILGMSVCNACGNHTNKSYWLCVKKHLSPIISRSDMCCVCCLSMLCCDTPADTSVDTPPLTIGCCESLWLGAYFACVDLCPFLRCFVQHCPILRLFVTNPQLRVWSSAMRTIYGIPYTRGVCFVGMMIGSLTSK